MLDKLRWAIAGWILKGISREVTEQRRRVEELSILYIQECRNHVAAEVKRAMQLSKDAEVG